MPDTQTEHHAEHPQTRELWLALDPRLVRALPADLREFWPQFLLPVSVTGAEDQPEEPAQRSFIGGLAALYATAPMSIHARIDGDVKLMIAVAVHSDVAAICLRIVDQQVLCARVVPVSAMIDVLMSLIPVTGQHTVTIGVRPAGVSRWRDTALLGVFPPHDPDELAAKLRQEIIRAEHARAHAAEHARAHAAQEAP